MATYKSNVTMRRRLVSAWISTVISLALVLLLVGMLSWSVFGRVTLHTEDGSTEEIAPITFVTN